MIVNHQSVVQRGDESRALERAVGIESRGSKEHVVGLPFAGLAAGIHDRRLLLVDRATLAIEVGLIDERVEDLQFIATHEMDAAVTATLTGAFDLGGRCEFEMQLAIAEALLRGDRVLGRRDFTVGDDPILAALPSVHIRSAEQNDRIFGSRAHRSRINDFGFRPQDAALPFLSKERPGH